MSNKEGTQIEELPVAVPIKPLVPPLPATPVVAPVATTLAQVAPVATTLAQVAPVATTLAQVAPLATSVAQVAPLATSAVPPVPATSIEPEDIAAPLAPELRSLVKGEEEAIMELNELKDENAAYVRKMAVTLSIILQDPEMQLNLALLVISGAHFLADVIYNSADIALIMGKALGPAARKSGYVGATFVNEATMVAFGTALSLIPGVGPLLGGWVNLTPPAMDAAGEMIWNFPGLLQRWEAIGEPIGESVGSINELTNQISGFTNVLNDAIGDIAGQDCAEDWKNMPIKERQKCKKLLINLKKASKAAAAEAGEEKVEEVKKAFAAAQTDQFNNPKTIALASAPPRTQQPQVPAVPMTAAAAGGSKKRKHRKKRTHKRRKKTKKHKKLKKRRKSRKKKKKQRRKKGTKKRALR